MGVCVYVGVRVGVCEGRRGGGFRKTALSAAPEDAAPATLPDGAASSSRKTLSGGLSDGRHRVSVCAGRRGAGERWLLLQPGRRRSSEVVHVS